MESTRIPTTAATIETNNQLLPSILRRMKTMIKNSDVKNTV